MKQEKPDREIEKKEEEIEIGEGDQESQEFEAEKGEFVGDLEEIERKSRRIAEQLEDIIESKEKGEITFEELKAELNAAQGQVEDVKNLYKEEIKPGVTREFFYENPGELGVNQAKNNIKKLEHKVKIAQSDLSRREEYYRSQLERRGGYQEKVQKTREKLEEVKERLLEHIDAIEKQHQGVGGMVRGIFKGRDKLERYKKLKSYIQGERDEPPTIYAGEDITDSFNTFRDVERDQERIKGWLQDTEESIEEEVVEARKQVRDRLKEEGNVAKKVEEMMAKLKELKEAEERWEEFLNSEVIDSFQLSSEDEERYRSKLSERNPRLAEAEKRSFSNIRESLSYFFKYFYQKRGMEKEEILDFLAEEREKVQETKFTAVNRSENGIRSVFKEGKFRNIWDFEEEIQRKKTRTIPGGEKHYLDKRKKIEDRLGIRGEHPVSCWLGSENGKDEFGGPPQYGDYTVILKDDVFKRTTFIESDSMNPRGLIRPLEFKKGRDYDVTDRQLNGKHAEIAKAMINAYHRRPGQERYSFPSKKRTIEYIESLVLGGVSKADIEQVVVEDPGRVPRDIRELLSNEGIELNSKVNYELKKQK